MPLPREREELEASANDEVFMNIILKGTFDESRDPEKSSSPTPTGSDEMSKLIQQYGCGPIPFTGRITLSMNGISFSTTSSN